MSLVLLFFGLMAGLPDFITVRNFSLVTDKGESVLRPDFDRRRLSDSLSTRRLTLKFTVDQKRFEFEFQKSYPIFAPDATIKISGQVQLRVYLLSLLKCATAVFDVYTIHDAPDIGKV